MEFIREKGVAAFAVGFIIGGAVSNLVGSLVNDILNPLTGLILGNITGLSTLTIKVSDETLRLGSFTIALIDFFVLVLVVYFGIKVLGIEKLDKKK